MSLLWGEQSQTCASMEPAPAGGWAFTNPMATSEIWRRKVLDPAVKWTDGCEAAVPFDNSTVCLFLTGPGASGWHRPMTAGCLVPPAHRGTALMSSCSIHRPQGDWVLWWDPERGALLSCLGQPACVKPFFWWFFLTNKAAERGKIQLSFHKKPRWVFSRGWAERKFPRGYCCNWK